MKKATLIIMAAGIGSRYGSEIKQLTPVGPNGEVIMDYSVYDAVEAGFNKVVFIIRKDLEKDFKKIIGNRIAERAEVDYVYQELSDVPEEFRFKWSGRTKPWGTGQAILCCKDIVREPFVVINADDYYGKEAYRIMYQYLEKNQGKTDKMNIGMVGFVLKNTLSDNGTVTRGVCKIDKNHMLAEIEETYKIKRCGDHAEAEKKGTAIELDLESVVSMNMWGLPAEFMSVLDKGFLKFLEELEPGDVETEYLLPRIIGEMLDNGKVQVKVLESGDKWFGVTYKEDRKAVVQSIEELIKNKIYPEKLF